MAQQTINIGAAPDDGTGDTLRVGGDKINDNFTELYTDYLPKAGGTLTGDLIVPADPYDATTWNGNNEVPTKDAVRDKIESLGASGLTVEDEGSTEGTGITTLNFTGSGASVTVVGSEAEIIIPGGISTFALGDATDVDTTGAAAGEALIYDGSGWVSAGGSAFPGSPATGHRFYRTDRNIEYFYDGTRWLSTQLFALTTPSTGTALSATTDYRFPPVFAGNSYDIYIETFTLTSNVTSATTGTNYFTARISTFENTGSVSTNLGSGLSTQSDTQNAWVHRSENINAVVANTLELILVSFTRVASGTAHLVASFTYRLVG